jgi:hypothetical protein
MNSVATPRDLFQQSNEARMLFFFFVNTKYDFGIAALIFSVSYGYNGAGLFSFVSL